MFYRASRRLCRGGRKSDRAAFGDNHAVNSGALGATYESAEIVRVLNAVADHDKRRFTALKSGAIDGYIAEEPTALAICPANTELDYLRLENNKTGFTATEKETGVAIALAKGSALRAQINAVLATISEETRYALMLQMADISAGKTVESLALTSETPAAPTGTLKIAMECAYEPYNWTDLNTPSLGAVPIYGEGGKVMEGRYANGYDVQIALYVANKLGLKLEVYAYDWDSLVPAVQSGAVDAIVAGMSPTPDREEKVDFTDMYYVSNLVIIYKKK